MTEIVLGPTYPAALEVPSEVLLAVRGRERAYAIDALAKAFAADPAAAFEWMVDNKIAHRVGAMLAPGPCRHVHRTRDGIHSTCVDCERKLS